MGIKTFHTISRLNGDSKLVVFCKAILKNSLKPRDTLNMLRKLRRKQVIPSPRKQDRLKSELDLVCI